MEEIIKTAIDNPQSEAVGTEPLYINKASDNEKTSPGENLILGKFKTVDDLALAYVNSEKLITKTRQELKRLQSEEKKPQSEQDMQNKTADNSASFAADESPDEAKNKMLTQKAENSPPPLIMKGSGEMMQAPLKKPTSFEEAGEAFLNYLTTLN